MRLPQEILDKFDPTLGIAPKFDIDKMDWKCDSSGTWVAEYEETLFKIISVPSMDCYALGRERKKEYGIGAV